MKLPSALAKWPLLQTPWVRYGTLCVGLGLWLYGLVEQLHSVGTTVLYLILTGLIAAVALL